MQNLLKMMGRVMAVASLGVVATTVEAHTTLITATSQHSRALRLLVEADAVTTATSTATLCSAPSGVVQEAKLWMPGMGHGSAPTQLESLDADCMRIGHINFFMAGAWEIQVRYADGDSAVIEVVVQD